MEIAPGSVKSGNLTQSLHQMGEALVQEHGLQHLVFLDLLPALAIPRIVMHGRFANSTPLFDKDLPLKSTSWVLSHTGWSDANLSSEHKSDAVMSCLRFQHLLSTPVEDGTGARLGIILALFNQDRSDLNTADIEQQLTQISFVYGFLLLHERYTESRVLFNDAAEFAHLGFWYRNTDTDLVYWSEETYRIFGEEPNSFQPSIDGYYSYLHPDDIENMRQAEMDSYAERKRLAIDHRIVRRNGDVRWVHLRGQIIWNEDNSPARFFGIVQDITEQKQTQLEFRQASMTDYLTNLANRRGFLAELRRTIEVSRGLGSQFFVTYIDLDYFKEVNDIYGHEVGDNLLNQFGNRLLDTSTDEHYIARIGGDEFAIIHGADGAIQTTLGQLTAAIIRPFCVTGIEVQLSVSMGTAEYPKDGDDPETLMARADDAMFVAKRSGRNLSLLFDSQMHQESERKARIRSGISRLNSETQDLYLHYQPIVQHPEQPPGYFEVLARWHDPELGPVSPAEFIPIAEETGLIRTLSRLIIERAIADIHAYKERLPEGFRFSLNLSPKELSQDDGGLYLLLEKVEQAPFLSQHLSIEITETAFLAEDLAVKQQLERAQSMGIPIALDDFGTGYSSLTHCHEYPIHALKIDRSFVQDYHSNKTSRDIVDSIVFLAKAMNLEVIAEGVESEEVATTLKQKVDWLQGYLISRPADLASFLS